MPGTFRLILKSIKFFRKPVSYQVLIIILLCAVITGSLLIGRSVKESLKKSASERLGNTGILISSGIRYFDPGLVQRLKDSASLSCTGLIELNGSCQSMSSQKGGFNTHIFGVGNDFFAFNGLDTISIKPGEIAINRKLADFLGIKKGEDLIIKYSEISDIPHDAPFSPGKEAGKSIVMRVGTILESYQTGNFSLSISQITPMNIFINLKDLEVEHGNHLKINRLLIKNEKKNSLAQISALIKQSLKPADVGIRLRKITKTGEFELVSDRIFIDETILKEISKLMPSAAPVLTYLANRFDSRKSSTPYSFISALPSSLYPEIADGKGMLINRWLANDLSAGEGDIVKMYWYSPDSVNKLIEKSGDFIIKRIVDMEGIWSDSLLMPDFPGIAGKESCSDWDAGVPIKMHEIRQRDEDYWNKYRGTPKAFISYETGKKLWGNNFGPATSVRFPSGLSENDILDKLNGSLDPDKMGFTITDLSNESVKAANESVDFGTLFLSLGFFLILASVLLLSFATSSYFNSKRVHISTLYALGFKNRKIAQILLLESVIISLTGCIAGVFTGYLVNILITRALNTVWTGAVQTNALFAYFNILPAVEGFLLTFFTIMALMLIKVKRYLNALNKKEKVIYTVPSVLKNLLILIAGVIATISLFVSYILNKDQQVAFSFAAGTLLLLTLVFSWRQYYINRSVSGKGRIKNSRQLSHLYYSLNPSNAVTPILFIAAGIFTIVITGANRMNFNEKQNKRSGGTGGYLLWCENTVAIHEDLNSESGRKTLGLDNDQLREMSFVQMKRSSGNDASCLNLNHITAPPIIGLDPDIFIAEKAFSFSKALAFRGMNNPWQFLDLTSENNTIYGIADQTVLEWGLKLKPGDTLVLRAENGQPLNIIIAAGLQSSVSQGNVLVGMKNFTKYYPSASGTPLFLVDGNGKLMDLYKGTLNERLENYGINIEKTSDRLVAFYEVTNTYLSVFEVFGAFGMIIGIAGLGFVLLRNYNQRKQEFAILLATGFSVKKIKGMILSELVLILFAGVSAGFISALTATSTSIKNSTGIPWLFVMLMIVAIVFSGLLAMFLSLRSVTGNSLILSLKKE
jgi:ABC-type antimicrobial peptide transport system permease subunit